MSKLRENPYWVVTLLWFVMIMSHVDRNILVILMGPIRDELELSDTWMGFLTGPAFALFYTFAGIPIARLADRRSRKLIIAIGLAAWSLCTVAQGFARNLWHFAALRVLLGVGEATASPPSHSLISDYFSPERRATALSFFSMGGHIGILIGLSLGGFLGETVGWRQAFVVVGIPGLLLALVVALGIVEPQRGMSEQREDEAQPSFGETLRHLFRKKSFPHITFGMSLYVMTVYGMNVWGPQLMVRVHGMELAEAGWKFGLATGISGALGTMVGGGLVDRLSRRDVRFGLWIPAIGGFGMIPFAFLFLFADEPLPALGAFAAMLFLTTLYMGPSFSLTQGLATLRMRAQAAAILLFSVNVIGSALGPQLIGILNDLLQETYGDEGIRYSLLVLVVASAWAAVHSLLGARTLAADLEARSD